MGAWILLSAALARNDGHYSRQTLLIALVACLLLGGAVILRIRNRASWPEAVPPAALAAALSIGLLGSLVREATLYSSGAAQRPARVLAVVAAAVALAAVSPRAARLRPRLLLLALTLGAGILLIVASPAPRIDVWVISQQATDALADLRNIYTQCWLNNTDVLTDCVYPYPPAAAVLQLPFKLALGDVRYALLAAFLAGGAVVAVVARGTTTGSGPTREGAAASLGIAALILVQPKWLFLIEQSWIEPLLFLALGAMVWATLRGHALAAVAGFAAALVVKQHVLLLLPLAVAWRAFGPRKAAAAVAVAGVVTLPWFLADPAAFVRDTLVFHLDLAARPDSLSLYSFATEQGMQPAFLLIVVVTLAALGIALLLPRDALGFTLGSAFVLLVFNLVNKQAFFNHHTLALQMIVLTLAVLHAGAGPAGAVSPEPAPPGPAAPRPPGPRRHPVAPQ